MKNKKVIFGIVLFLLIGLAIFTFANPAENEEVLDDKDNDKTEEKVTKDDNDDQTEETDEQTTNNNLASDNTNTNVLAANNQSRNTNASNGSGVYDVNVDGNNGSSNNGGNSDNNQTTDNKYNEALKAVEKAEATRNQADVDAAAKLVADLESSTNKTNLENRLADVQNIIDVMAMIAKMELDLEEADARGDIVAISEYKSEQNVAEKIATIKDEELLEELTSRYEAVSVVVDDDENPEFDVQSGTHFNKETDIEVTDENFDYVMYRNNDKDTEYTKVSEDKFTLTDEGTYHIIAYDKAMLETEIYVAIDKHPPLISGVENNGLYNSENGNLNVVVTDKFLQTVTVDGVTYTRGESEEIKLTGTNNEGFTFTTNITEEGTHTIEATDKVGNKVTYTFTIDKTAPIYTKLAILNKDNLNNGDTKYAKIGDTIRVFVYFDEKLAVNPQITINGIKKEATYKEGFTKNGYAYVVDYKITADANFNEGMIEVKVSDYADEALNVGKELTNADINYEKYPYVIFDSIAPTVVETSQVWEDEEDGRVKLTVKFSEAVAYPFDSLNWRKVSDTEYYTYYYRSKEDKITFKDLAGNEGVYTISVDADCPEVVDVEQVYEDKEDGRIKTTVKFSEAVAYPFDNLNWRKVSDTEYYTYFYKTKDYTINFNDLAGNPGSYTINVDATAPSVIDVEQVYEDKEDGRIKTTVTFDEKVVYPFDSLNWRKVSDTEYYTYFYKTKDYVINFKDEIGNPNSYTIKVDMTAPVLEVKDYIGDLERKIFSNVSFKLSDGLSGIKKININGQEISYTVNAWGDANYNDIKGYLKDGLNTVVLYDAVGNKTTEYEFTYDVTAPAITVKDGYVGNKEQNIYSEVSFKLMDNVGVSKVVVNNTELDRSFNTVSDANFQNIKAYLNEGVNTITLYDAALNKKDYTFTYDVTAPKISYTLTPDGVTNGPVTVTLTANEPIVDLEGWTRIDNQTFTKVFEQNEKVWMIFEDLAGNKTENTLIEVKRIDKVNPSFVGLTNNKYFNHDVTYKVTKADENNGVDFAIKEESVKTIIIDGVSYNEKEAPKTISGEGKHTIKVIDKALNESEELTFVIDETKPVLEVKEFTGNETSKLFSKISFKLKDNMSIASVYINGVERANAPATSGDANFQNIKGYLKAGQNTIVLYDLAGNASEEYVFTYDNEAPTVVESFQTDEGDRVKYTVKFSEAVVYPFSTLEWRKVSDTEYYTYYYRSKEQTLNFEDLAGNEGTYTFNVVK